MKRTLWVGLLLLVAVLLYSIASFVHEDLTKREPGKVFKADLSDEGTVTARAWVEPSEYEPGAQARCWIRLENRTKDRVTRLRFAVAQALPSSLKVAAKADFTDRINRELNARLGPAGSLPTNGVASFWTTLPFPKKSGQYDFDLVYRWDAAAENRLLIGPLDVPGPLERWMQAGSSIYGVAKDMAVPLAVVFLTWAFSHYDDRRKATEAAKEKIQLAAEEKKEQARKEAERHTQQARETWSRMLLISHRDTKKYYLPLLSSVRRITGAMEEPREKGWKDLAFFHLMMFLCTMARLKSENGGFYLKSRAGEDALAGLWFLLQKEVVKRFTLAHLEPAVGSLHPNETFASFQMKWGSSRFADLAECARRFSSWPDADLSIYAPLLNLFYWILRYEANLAYVYWYGEIEAPPKEIGQLKKALMEGVLAEKVRNQQVDGDLDRYEQESKLRYQQLKDKLQEFGQAGVPST